MPPLGSGDTMDMDALALALALSKGNDLPLPPPTGEGEINDGGGRDAIGRAIVDDEDADAGVALGNGSNSSDDGTRDNDVGVVGMDRGGVMVFSGAPDGVVAIVMEVVVAAIGDGTRTIGVRYPSGLSQKNPTMRL